ncbi:unnamed protein product [Meganyctiphanes norvegica]|uniref:Uncharacterized protein n=1 Tax=Meganyctiphanes norvegica TaxID=48144 RepID=A0AAV2REC7_MEGNR
MMQAAFGDVVGIENPFSPLAFLSVMCSLSSISYAVASFLGEDKKDKIVKFIATFITTGVRVTTNSMYGRHSFGLFMYVLPMFSTFIFICICNFLYGIFISPTFDGKAEDNNTYIKEKENSNIKMLNNTGRKLLMSVVSASCDGFSINGLLASIAFLPWVIWPFVDNLSIGMLEPGFTISVSCLSTALAGMLLNIIILICRGCRVK